MSSQSKVTQEWDAMVRLATTRILTRCSSYHYIIVMIALASIRMVDIELILT